MFKKLNRMWFNSLQKAGKAQLRQATKVVKALAASPRKAKKSAKGKVAASPARPATSAAPAGTWTSGIHISPGIPARRMRYRLFVPASANTRSGEMPLLVMLHGCQQDAGDFAAGTGMNGLAAAKGYAVLYPEQSLRTHPHRCWKWYDSATQRGGGDIATIARMVEQTAGLYPIDRSRIYACGISAGAAMAQILALTHPQLIAAVGMHSGPVFGAGRNAVGAYGVMQHGSAHPLGPIQALLSRHPGFPPMPAILITGDRDDVVRPINQQQLERQFIELNHATPLVAVPLLTQLFGRVSKAWPRKRTLQVRDFRAGAAVMVRSVRIEGLGHAWSGGDEAFSFNAKGPDAGKLMLAFFSRHRRRGAAPH